MQFKEWFYKEDEVHSLKGKGKPENYLDGMFKQLNIDPNSIPKYIPSGPVDIDDLSFNAAWWEVIKPINLDDKYVKIRFYKSNSPSVDQVCSIIKHGKKIPYKPAPGELENRTFLQPIDKFAQMLGKGWEMAIQNPSPMGGMGGMS